MNVTLLAKLRWYIITDPDDIWVKVVSAKYLIKVNFSREENCQGFNNMKLHSGSKIVN